MKKLTKAKRARLCRGTTLLPLLPKVSHGEVTVALTRLSGTYEGPPPTSETKPPNNALKSPSKPSIAFQKQTSRVKRGCTSHVENRAAPFHGDNGISLEFNVILALASRGDKSLLSLLPGLWRRRCPL